MTQKSFIIGVTAVAISLMLIALLFLQKPAANTRPPTDDRLQVQVATAELQDYQVILESFGSIKPAVQSQLLAQVSGTVTNVSEAYQNGARVEQGQQLIKIDDSNYQNALSTAQAQYSEALTRLTQEQATADQALLDWQRLEMTGEPTDLLLRKPQVNAARAQLNASQAAIKDAQLNIQRTIIRAPYTGRIIDTAVNLGQFVNLGSLLGTVYQEGVYEVDLPLSQSEFFMLDPAIRESSAVSLDAQSAQADVELRNGLQAYSAPETRTWSATIVQTGSQFDQVTRQIMVTARLNTSAATGLLPGEYVTARIQGRRLETVFVIPNQAIKKNRAIYVLQETLSLLPVDIIWSDEQFSVIAFNPSSGLQPGMQYVISPLSIVPDGTPAKVLQDEVANVDKVPDLLLSQ